MHRVLGGALVAALAVAAGIALSAPAVAPAQGGGQLQVGVGVEDASWHVGASAGQYAGAPEDPQPSPNDPGGNVPEFVDHESQTFDPTGHSTRRYPSYGVQSRLSVRAIVIDGPAAGAADRLAILKTDSYIPQDLVARRAGQILEQQCPDCGISFGDATTPGNMTMTATHDHSSPFYSSTSWGVWAFQDVFDIRFYEYMAQTMADAVEEAVKGTSQSDDELSQGLTPARMAVRSTYYDKSHRHSFGPARADDGTPAGYPQSDQDHDMSVIRFDEAGGEPLANLVNFSQHPEFLEGNDLISADYVAPFERMMDRETGAATVYTQGSVGTSEPERSSFHSVHERLEFSHRNYAQAEWGARLMTDAAKGAWERIEADDPPDYDGDPATPPDKYLPYSSFGTDPEIEMADRWFPGPFSHPYPGVSNCKVSYPGVPIAGLPDCERPPFNPQDVVGAFGVPAPVQDAINQFDPGVPIETPENYSAFSYAGLQEDLNVHLQAVRIGELLLPMCSCEQWWDQSRNIELRTDKIVGNEDGALDSLGYDWGARCTKNFDGSYPDNDDGLGSGAGTGTWNCPNASSPTAVTNHEYQRMRAQVNNPANGWNNLENAAAAEGEPDAPDLIKGNYTHDDRCGPTPLTAGDSDAGCSAANSASASLGYDLTVPIGMANDYNGYIASYREYQRGDHYRKALTGWGPHSSDYMASRLVTLGRQFRNPAYVRPTDQIQEDPAQAKVTADLALNDQRATALGEAAEATLTSYEAGLPADGGADGGEVVSQPEDIERFNASFFTWIGGSNYTDNPEVRVQRRTGPGPDDWEDYADQSGELPVTLKFPSVQGAAPVYAQGDQEWNWTARFEAFVAGAEDKPINTGDRAPATPPGTYRFVAEGQRREGAPAQVVDYELESEEFEVRPWDGILPQDFNLEGDNTMSFRVGPTSTFNNPVPGCAQDTIGPIDYPDTMSPPGATAERPDPQSRFIRNQRTPFGDGDNSDCDIEWFNFTGTWRPWLDFGDADTAKVTVTLGNGTREVVGATRQGGRWVTSRKLRQGETAQVLSEDAGAGTEGVLDPYGNTNQPSAILGGGTEPADADGDGDLDGADNCIGDPNPDQADGDNDGIGDVCDTLTDRDGDGVGDSTDQCPDVPGTLPNGCPPPPLDTDGDGIPDSADDCDAEAGPPGAPGSNGCPDPTPTDGDGDGVPDNADNCPNAPGPIDNFGCPRSSGNQAGQVQSSSDCGSLRAGTPQPDSLVGTTVGDLLRGLGGGDQIAGGEGPDCLFGGRGRDGLDGEGGNDLVRGGDGKDRAAGSAGDDVVSGGRGRDRLSGGDGNDSLRAVDGDPDRLDCGPGEDSARVAEGDRTRACESVKRVKGR